MGVTSAIGQNYFQVTRVTKHSHWQFAVFVKHKLRLCTSVFAGTDSKANNCSPHPHGPEGDEVIGREAECVLQIKQRGSWNMLATHTKGSHWHKNGRLDCSMSTTVSLYECCFQVAPHASQCQAMQMPRVVQYGDNCRLSARYNCVLFYPS